jgi:DNA helicase II / ATP-dependent DNA helicase PcrA
VIEYRVFGPPGTGKTTWLARNVEKAVEAHGSANVMVASFTRTAAQEVAGRNLPIDRGQIGTLHSHAYRAIGTPEVAAAHIEEWNAENPAWALSGGKQSLDEVVEQTFATDADEVAARYDVLRARMAGRELWPQSVRDFASRWEAWKAGCGYVDFTDMIERALRDTSAPVGSPTVGFYDEAQDFTPLELALVRRWAESQEYIVIAGDDDQCLYHFKGSTPDAFLTPLPEENKRVLSQSYRVPSAVQAVAERWIAGVRLRENKVYRPREEAGVARTLVRATYKAPDAALADAQGALAAGKSVMFLASCGYMLDPLKALLRREGIPFHNPFRTSRGDRNPLGVTSAKKTTSRDRLLSFLRPQSHTWGEEARMWTGIDLLRWTDLIKGVLHKGARADIEMMPALSEVPVIDILRTMPAEALTAALDGDLDWLESVLVAGKRKPMEFPLTVARRHGGEALRRPPQVILGTIHSVKGGQADLVYVFPDLSLSGVREWLSGGEDKDAVTRMFYVGMTRAREEFVLCGRATQWCPDTLETICGGA